MSVVSKLNDAVGGVDVVIPESANGLEKGWTTGAEVHLEGDAAYQFIHYRDTAQEQSAEARLERQKQYLKKFEILILFLSFLETQILSSDFETKFHSLSLQCNKLSQYSSQMT